MSLSVKGVVENSSESFTGTLTGDLSGAGSLKLISSKAIECTGNYDAVTYQAGKGKLTCNDGRSGAFEFIATDSKGTGQGVIGSEQFTFTFGF